MELEPHHKTSLSMFFGKLNQLREAKLIGQAEFDRKNSMDYYHSMIKKGCFEPYIDLKG